MYALYDLSRGNNQSSYLDLSTPAGYSNGIDKNKLFRDFVSKNNTDDYKDLKDFLDNANRTESQKQIAEILGKDIAEIVKQSTDARGLTTPTLKSQNHILADSFIRLILADSCLGTSRSDL